MTDMQNSTTAQVLLDQGAYEHALRIAGPQLEANPDNLPAWYQVASAAAHLTAGETWIKNLFHALLALVQGGQPLWALISMKDALVTDDLRNQLIETVISQYSSGTSALSDLPLLTLRNSPLPPPKMDLAPWSDALSRDELCQMADSLCAVAWGHSLERLQNGTKGEVLPIFSCIGLQSFRTLANAMVVHHAPKGETLISGGTQSDMLQVIANGSASGGISTGHHGETPYAVNACDIIGEESLVTGNAETTTLTAGEPCTLLQIPYTALLQIAQQETAMAMAVVGDYQKRIVSTLIHHNPVLLSIDFNRRSELLRQMHPAIFKKKTPVLSSSTTSTADDDGCILVFSGCISETRNSVAASASTPPGNSLEYRRGDWIDLKRWKRISAPRELHASENTVLLKLSRTAFHAILSEYPQLAEAMYPL